MPLQYLTAFEHYPLPIDSNGSGPSLTDAEADYLTLLSELRPGFCERGYRSVRLAQYCGIVSLGTRVLEILPKVEEHGPPEESRGILLRLLREAEDLSIFRHLPAGQGLRSASLLEVFIAAFFDAVTEIVRGGLLRLYQEREDDLQVVRGRIVASRQFAGNSNRHDRIACRFDELTADNVWNQLIKAGLHAVRPGIASVELSRRWIELMIVFDEVNGAAVGTHTLSRLVFDRHAARYRVAISWVGWILRLLSPSLRAGRNQAPGLLFDMNQLFQSAVAAFLRRRVGGPTVRVFSQDTEKHLALVNGSITRRAFQLRPDIVVRKGERIAAIGDTKWKRLEVTAAGYLKPAPADIYQMHAYAGAFECEHLALIYPWHDGLHGSKETAFELPQVGRLTPTVNVICVDIGNDLRALRGQEAAEFATFFAL